VLASKMQPSDPIFKRRFLGTFSDEIYYQQRVANAQRALSHPLVRNKLLLAMNKRTDDILCGRYERGTVIRNARIKFSINRTRFYFITRVLNERERDSMQDIPNIMLRNNVPMYSSNPYHCEIGQMKLYYDCKTRFVHRCIIEDLYCVFGSNKLFLGLDILLIDKGEYLRSVHHRDIYDFSQCISHLGDPEEEAKLARLDLDLSVGAHGDIQQAFEKFISSSPQKSFDLKVCGIESGRVYLVDLVLKGKETFLGRAIKELGLSGKVISQSSCKPKEDVLEMDLVRQVITRPQIRRRQFDHQGRQSQRIPTETFNGALDFFRRRLARQCVHQEDARAKRQLLKVALLDWYGPDHIALVPFDRDYSLCHKLLVKNISAMKCVRNAGKNCDIRMYKPGEFVLFKNSFGDSELGEWLRGVVVSMSCYNEHNLVVAQGKTLKEKLENFEIVKRLVKDKKQRADDLIYRVRSVDYGCECRCSPINMRYVNDLDEFKRQKTWSLRCRLFGVHKFPGEQRFSRETMNLFDSWIREKMLEDGSVPSFSIMFRTILNPHMFDGIFDISLFHRHDSMCLIDKNFKPKPTRFECLNWYLIDKGSASPGENGENSNIQLEDHVMGVLFKHGRI
jgi:hypothetical protein